MSNTLEEILDAHAKHYIQATIAYIKAGKGEPTFTHLNEADVKAYKAMTDLITLHTQKAKRLSRIDEVRRAQETISYVKLTPEEKRTGNTRTGKYLIDRLEYLNIPTEAGEL